MGQAKPKQPSSGTKASAAEKAARRKAEAERLGITVDELEARRRAEHRENQARKAANANPPAGLKQTDQR